MADSVEILEQGLVLIRKGWTQHKPVHRSLFGGKKYCAEGAIMNVHSADSRGLVEAYAALKASLPPLYPSYPYRIWMYNDARHTRKRHIIALFERAIEYEKQRKAALAVRADIHEGSLIC